MADKNGYLYINWCYFTPTCRGPIWPHNFFWVHLVVWAILFEVFGFRGSLIGASHLRSSIQAPRKMPSWSSSDVVLRVACGLVFRMWFGLMDLYSFMDWICFDLIWIDSSIRSSIRSAFADSVYPWIGDSTSLVNSLISYDGFPQSSHHLPPPQPTVITRRLPISRGIQPFTKPSFITCMG